jgi:hypothetical protein
MAAVERAAFTCYDRSPARTLFCGALAVSWLVMLLYAWSAFSSLPSPERLEISRMARLPTFTTMTRLAGRSAAELAVMIALAWPVPRRYVPRLLAAVLALPVWFILTVPLTLTVVEWVHRRWLAAAWIGLLLALIASLCCRAWTHHQEGG